MYKLEGDLRSDFTKHVNAQGCKAQPIESGTTGLGIPDWYVRTPKVSAWAEFKNLRFPLNYPLEVPFKPGQYTWLKRHWALGGTSLLIIGTIEGIYVWRNEHIQKVYVAPFYTSCGLHMPNLSGKVFVEWLDKMEYQDHEGLDNP
jgi:hypothetical protein